jgi:hypothetical protein
MLAVNPTWQDWIIEEIDQVNQQPHGASMGYKEVFPNLPRCMALLVRIYVPDDDELLTKSRSMKPFVFSRQWPM